MYEREAIDAAYAQKLAVNTRQQGNSDFIGGVALGSFSGMPTTKPEGSPLHSLASAQQLSREACAAVCALADELVGADPSKGQNGTPQAPGLFGALDATARDIALSARLVLGAVARIRSQLP